MASTRLSPRTALAAFVMSGLLLATAVPASADADKARTGRCSGAATWRLELDRDPGEIDVELKIRTPRSGRTWRVVLRHNGTQFYSRLRTTNRYGQIEVERERPDRRGTDTFSFRATNVANGQVCQGSLSI